MSCREAFQANAEELGGPGADVVAERIGGVVQMDGGISEARHRWRALVQISIGKQEQMDDDS